MSGRVSDVRALAATISISVAVFAAAPALACEGPQFHSYALRSAPPEVVNPGELVLELDTDSMQTLTRPPSVFEIEGRKFDLSHTYGVFDVQRVHTGSYVEKQATIPLGFGVGCWFLYEGPDARYLVASPAVDEDGFAYLVARPIRGYELPDYRVEDQKAAN